MRKLSTLLIAGLGLFAASCNPECTYRPVAANELVSDTLLDKYEENYNTLFTCFDEDTLGSADLPPDNGNYVVGPTRPCPPPQCLNPVLKAAVSSESDAVLILGEGENARTLNAILIQGNGIKPDTYYGFADTSLIMDNQGILKMILVENGDSLVRYIIFE